jgi:hypothetical protein
MADPGRTSDRVIGASPARDAPARRIDRGHPAPLGTLHSVREFYWSLTDRRTRPFIRYGRQQWLLG